jgi:PPP family 3-phenylpropionic acid transporter
MMPPGLALSLFYAGYFAVLGIQLPFWPYWLKGRGLDAAEIALVLSAVQGARVVATPLVGRLADRARDRRAVMAACAAVTLLGLLALMPAAGFWPILAAMLVAGAAYGAMLPLGDSLTLLTVAACRLDYGRIRLWGSVAFIAAAALVGRLLAGGSPERMLQALLVPAALLLLLCRLLPRTPAAAQAAAPAAAQAAAPARGAASGIMALLRRPDFLCFMAAAGLGQASHGAYYTVGTLHWEAAGLSPTVIGLLWAEGVVAEIVLLALGRPLADRLGPAGMLALAGAAGLLRWSAVALTTDLPVLALLQLLHGLTFGANLLGTMRFLGRALPPHLSATGQAVYAAVAGGIALGLSMMLAGQIYPLSATAAWLAMAGLSLAGVLFTPLLARLERPA